MIIKQLPNTLTRTLTADEIKSYQDNGAAVIRNVVDEAWLAFMREEISSVLACPTKGGYEYTDQTGKEGRFYGDYFLWLQLSGFEKFFRESPMVELAANLMESEKVNIFYDHLLVKEPKADSPTPLHHDAPYWPVKGNDIVTIWVPFDSVTRESGVVQYIKGSHKWGKRYAPQAFSDDSGFSDMYKKQGLEDIRDVEGELHKYDILCENLEPGDVLVHHPLTLHFAEGNTSQLCRRRALALRYTGDDAVFDDRPGTFMEHDRVRSIVSEVPLSTGDPMDCDIFPKVWPRPS